MEVITGVLFHSVGASSAALCYTPQKKVVQWSWQTYWLAQAFICWLLLPVIIAWITIPQIQTVLREAPAEAMWKSFGLGMLYGIGGTAFGFAIRYVGFSLTYAIAVGISCVLGTLLPYILGGNLLSLFNNEGAGLIFSGIGLGVAGIALSGMAGRYKELDLERNKQLETAFTGEQQTNNAKSTFSLAKGLPLCFLAGVLSAVYGLSIDAGGPIADVAERYGSGNYQINVIYIFCNSGAFLTTLIYCIYLHKRDKTFGEYRQIASGNRGKLILNFIMAMLTGVLWYTQFFFYGLGHVHMGMGGYAYTSWAIHMIMLVLFSALAGLLMKEWSGVRRKTTSVLLLALLVLIASVLVLTFAY